MTDLIREHFYENARLNEQCAEELSPFIREAIDMMFNALANGNKILACGNGGSAADCQHFAAELVGRFERERMPLAAIALTTDSSILTSVSNDYEFHQIYVKQVQALGQPGDILLAISTSGNSPNILHAITTAQEREMRVIGLSGKGGGKMNEVLREREDLNICVSHERTARIQEIHLLVIHCLCDGLDVALFGEEK